MSWQLGSFLILAVGLAAAFGWYERSRPSARVLSLVAALAALAVVGRLAFAAFPNVKPTTDIILLAGYALGAAPGFAVGAITPVASNVFMGQGAWTPWQMAAWGGVGVGGALLHRLARGRTLGRWRLALACGVAGACFGVVMDTYQWTLAAQQDVATWLAIAASSLPYNLAHVIGNVVFCLLVGPAFLRVLERYRRRFEVTWRPAAAGPAAAAALAAAALLVVTAPAAAASPASRAASWLEGVQNRDGGFGAARGERSSPLFTGWASLGLAAAGRNPRDVRTGRRSAIDFIRRGAGRMHDVGEIERTMLVLDAAGLSARRFAGHNLVARLKRHRRGDGSFRGYVSYTAFGVLALRSASSGPVAKSARWLARQQNDDGGFGVSPRAQSDVDNTGAVLQALGAAGRADSAAAGHAVAYLRRAQNRDGGFGQGTGRSSNAQSTAYAVQGLLAVGRRPGRFRAGGRTPIAYLRALQRPDGSVRYSRTSAQTPVWVTAQALMALRRKPFPLGTVARERRARAGAAGARTESRADEAEPGDADAKAEAARGRESRSRRTSRTADEDGPLGPPAPQQTAAVPVETASQEAVADAGDRSPTMAGWMGAGGSAAAVVAAGWAGLAWRRRRQRPPGG